MVAPLFPRFLREGGSSEKLDTTPSAPEQSRWSKKPDHPPFLTRTISSHLYSHIADLLMSLAFSVNTQSNLKRGHVYFNQRSGVSAIAMQKLGVFNANIGVDKKTFLLTVN